MLFTGRRLDAQEALQHGVVSRVVPHENLRAVTEQAVRDLLLSAPKARAALKRIINSRYGLIDKLTFEESLAGSEVTEGFAAFVEKRAPAWVPESMRAGGRV
jgi:enoyl-CoA hydratase/carnithine racemase